MSLDEPLLPPHQINDAPTVPGSLHAHTASMGLLETPINDTDEVAIILEKSRSPMRWPVLVLACLMLIGSYYCFDIPSALKTQINDYMAEDKQQYETKFALLYTIYAAPNVILPFFGGYFVDRFGVGLCLLVFASLIALGQCIVALGFWVRSWPVIFLGRLVFALGGENLIVANSALLADWFKGKELAFAFGVNLSIARVGSVVNNILSPALTNSAGLIFALWFGAITCAASVVCVLLTIPIDANMDAQLALQRARLDRESRLSYDKTAGAVSVGYAAINGINASAADGGKGQAARSVGGVGALLDMLPRWIGFGTHERARLMGSEEEEDAGHGNEGINSSTGIGGAGLGLGLGLGIGSGIGGAGDAVAGGEQRGGETHLSRRLRSREEEEEKDRGKDRGRERAGDDRGGKEDKTLVSYRDVLTMPHIFWVLVLFCVTMYGSVLPFNNIASSLLLERDYFLAPNAGCRLLHQGQCQSAANPPVNCTNLQDDVDVQPPLPVNITNAGVQLCTGYGAQCVAVDVDCTSDFWLGCAEEYCSRLTKAEKDAAVVMSIPYIISGVVSPIIGLAIDKFGHRATIATLAAATVIVVHVSIGYTKVSPVGPLVGQGLAYTGFAAVLWPAIPLVITPKLTGLAFGIVTSALNLGCAVLPIVVAQLYIRSGDVYIPNVELLFVVLGAVSLALGLYLNYFDFHNGGVLNRGETPELNCDSVDGSDEGQDRKRYRSVARDEP